MQILVLVATCHVGYVTTVVDKGSEETAFALGLVGPKRMLQEQARGISLLLEREKGLNSFTCSWLNGDIHRIHLLILAPWSASFAPETL